MKASGPSLALTVANLQEVINDYLEDTPSIDVMARNTLKSTFTLKDKLIVFELANPLEKGKVESEKPALLNHLRIKFGEAELNVSYEVNVAVGNSRPYTPKEKFDAMIEKNPILAQLKEKLGLDTDY